MIMRGGARGECGGEAQRDEAKTSGACGESDMVCASGRLIPAARTARAAKREPDAWLVAAHLWSDPLEPCADASPGDHFAASRNF